MANQKRNKTKQNHIDYFNLAFEQAKINLGSTNKNPSVGCVVEKNGSILSSGYTSINGYPHAEFNALNKEIDFKDSNLYVTLEPCIHYGKTPPCTNIIVRKKIKNVFYSLDDFDPRTRKKAKLILQKEKIKVKKNYLTKKAVNFYKSYINFKMNKLPVIDAKIAISKDFFTIFKKRRWITSAQSRIIGQFLRTKYECLLTTSSTVNKDDPILNCRINGLENKSPDLIIIDRNSKLKKNLQIFKIMNKKRRIFIFTYNNKNKNFYKSRINNNTEIITIKRKNNKEEFISILKILRKKGYSRIFIETGLTFISFMIKEKFINYLYIFRSNYKLNKKGKNNCTMKYLKKVKLNNKENVFLYGDSLFKEKLNNV